MVFDQYRLVRKLGEGGMGTVFEAVQTKLDKPVAVKFLPPAMLRDADAVARFEREMRAIGSVEHPHIVRAMHAAEHHGLHYLVMEFVEGTDLARLVDERGPLPVSAACKLIRQAALGLNHAHQQGLVHRDIKPSNLLLSKSGHVKILDLGLARFGADRRADGQITTAGQVLGTPDYMAPEQWDDTAAADHRADLYALGCTLFCLLTGRAPYADEQHVSLTGKMKGHVSDPIPDLQSSRREGRMGRLSAAGSGGSQATVKIDDDVPPAVDEIYRRLMAKNSAERFQDAVDLASALQKAGSSPGNRQGRTKSPHEREATRAVAPAVAVPLMDAPLRSFPRARSRSRRPLVVSAAVVFGVAVVALISYSVMGDRTNDARPPAEGEAPIGNETPHNSAAKAIDRPGDRPPETAVANKTEPPTGWQGWPADAPSPAIAPFRIKQASQYQEAWAAYLKLPVEWENSIGVKFRLIPPGEFLMGTPPSEFADVMRFLDLYARGAGEEFAGAYRRIVESETPQHRVILTKPYYLSVYELTQGQFSEMGSGAEYREGLSEVEKEKDLSLDEINRMAACGMTWEHLRTVCATYSRMVVRDPAARSEAYDLPTEAQWEYACRAGTATRFWGGDSSADLAATDWVSQNSGGHRHAVGGNRPNPFGLCDLHGNVAERCRDYWSPDYYREFEAAPAVNPQGPALPETFPLHPSGYDAARVVRGGSHTATPDIHQRSASRNAVGDKSRDALTGCRLTIGVEAVRSILENQKDE